jgi:Rad3-related DNA helicase
LNSTLRIAVGKLVDFACRSGDLVTGGSGPSAAEGIVAHQAIQRQLADEYQSEIDVGTTLTQAGYELELRGRVDLLKAGPDGAIIAEIKTCYGDPRYLPQSQTELHWSQLKIYGFCYLREFPAQSILLRMIWYDVLSQQSLEQSVEFDFQQLQAFSGTAIDKYLHWQQLILRLNRTSRDTATELSFPFGAFRPGQHSMASAVFRCLRDGAQLLCEAPTGIGKTVSALFPALKALAHDHVDKIVYLTAKNSGRQVAWDTITMMRDSGLRVPTLMLQAKAAACACQNGGCELDPQGQCPRTLGFFDRLPAARQQLVESGIMHSEAIATVAQQYQLCPFELALQLLPWSTLVICDYNYIFDPLVGLGYFTETDDRVALLVDEAHNLVDRARQMYSAELLRSDSQLAVAGCKTSRPALSRHLAGISRALNRWQRETHGSESVINSPPATINRALDRLHEALAQELANGEKPVPELADWLRALVRYRHIAELFGPHHRCITRCEPGGSFREFAVKLACLNASDQLQKLYKNFRGLVFFSATLRPPGFYQKALGLAPECQTLSLPSPFSSDQLGTFICGDIDTRYQQRRHSIVPIAELVQHVYQSRPGNYLVFFPSYHYLHLVAEAFVERYPDTPLLCQQAQSSETARKHFLQQFHQGQRILGFAIMGGVFGEGIDYHGDSLIGAIVIGVGLPGVTTEQELIRQDFSDDGRNGFDFAYRFPGFSRVLQAGGRVIRSETDRGIVVLVDQRFAQGQYRSLLPDHWRPRVCRSQQQLRAALGEFWHAGEQCSQAPGAVYQPF